VIVHSFAVIAARSFSNSTPATLLGRPDRAAGTQIREHVTINRSIHAGQATSVGARCFLMANSHVGHDSVVADDVSVGQQRHAGWPCARGQPSFLGGGAGFHQFCRIGEGSSSAGSPASRRTFRRFAMAAERNEIIGSTSSA